MGPTAGQSVSEKMNVLAFAWNRTAFPRLLSVWH